MEIIEKCECSGLSTHLKNFPYLGNIVVSKEKKLLYVKPPKTAGTSIARGALVNMIPDIFHLKDNKDTFLNWLNTINDNELDSYYKFIVTRNPYDRFISNSSYLKIPINELIHGLENNTLTGKDEMHCLPQHIFCHMDDKIFVNRILRFENLQNEFDSLCDELSMERFVLPFQNKTIHKSFEHYYDEQLKERVYQYYKFDFEKLGYSKKM